MWDSWIGRTMINPISLHIYNVASDSWPQTSSPNANTVSSWFPYRVVDLGRPHAVCDKFAIHETMKPDPNTRIFSKGFHSGNNRRKRQRKLFMVEAIGNGRWMLTATHRQMFQCKLSSFGVIRYSDAIINFRYKILQIANEKILQQILMILNGQWSKLNALQLAQYRPFANQMLIPILMMIDRQQWWHSHAVDLFARQHHRIDFGEIV